MLTLVVPGSCGVPRTTGTPGQTDPIVPLWLLKITDRPALYLETHTLGVGEVKSTWNLKQWEDLDTAMRFLRWGLVYPACEYQVDQASISRFPIEEARSTWNPERQAFLHSLWSARSGPLGSLGGPPTWPALAMLLPGSISVLPL